MYLNKYVQLYYLNKVFNGFSVGKSFISSTYFKRSVCWKD